VLRADANGTPELAKHLQDHVKSILAPYKYPRIIEFLAALPRTATGKLKRFDLRCVPSTNRPNLTNRAENASTATPAAGQRL
jgi:acyl-coenzyme A synthetase/AMP-(fatty) acid ligase